MRIIIITYDKSSDVLYLRYENETIKNSNKTPNDGYLIIDYNSDKVIAGIRILFISEIDIEFWNNHPDKSIIPEDIFVEVSCWIKNVKA